ncbi:4619_t:CDS:2, partial [Racocetra persica]
RTFNEEIKPLLTKFPFIALDECSFYPNLDPRFGYSLKGSRAGGANWRVFYDFLEEMNPIGDKRNILLMDNARIHTAPNKRMEVKLPTVEEQMEKRDIEIKFIAAYAPMLNPH